ncbi:kinase-like protein [Exidia glandulosa HHB12029]|uniref:Kinase-like protein n=1 Tax=Exidia glandulosa HHB12029 TaxID=1314781 RepID=A0A165MCZ2_EXIGL|nr:kinase-like protein [Exidia glandulosa HHB12029]
MDIFNPPLAQFPASEAFQLSWAWLRYKLYYRLTVATDHNRVRPFRFGIPLVLKWTNRTYTTESHALRFLNYNLPDLPVPRLVDSVELNGATYTVMTRLPGVNFQQRIVELASAGEIEPYQIANAIVAVTEEIKKRVLPRLWSLTPSDERVMLSASGDGLPSPVCFNESYYGPFENRAALAVGLFGRSVPDDPLASPEWQRIVNDRVVWVHTDFRVYNILVTKDLKFVGVIDWEDSGWCPRYWQLAILRQLGPGCFGAWWEDWAKNTRFDEETEAAYEAMTQVRRWRF